MLINGTTVTVKVAHVRLCHSRMLFVRAYPRETQEMVFDAHDRAFAFFKGACTRGIYDNMKTAVESDLRRQGARLQPPLPADVRPLPGRTGRLHAGLGLGEGPGREPGRGGARALLHAAAAGEELRGAERLAARSLHRLRQGAPPSRAARPDGLGGVRGGAAAAWCPMPGASTASTRCRPRSRRPAWCASTTTNTRSRRAPSAARSRSAPMPIGSSCARTDALVGEHRRSFGRDETVYDPWHYVPVLARKPGALRNGAPFKDWVLPAGARAGPPQARPAPMTATGRWSRSSPPC